MNQTPSWTWALLAAGIAIALAGATLLGWALFRDRAKGRRRCPRCWYDMSAVPGMQCPECGRAQKSERRFARTHRRWRWAAAGLALILLGAGTAIGFGTAADPLLALVPTRVWVELLPFFDDQAKKVYDTRMTRGVPVAVPTSGTITTGVSGAVTVGGATGTPATSSPQSPPTAAALAAAISQSMLGARTGYTRWERLLLARHLAVKGRADDFASPGAYSGNVELEYGLRSTQGEAEVTMAMLTRSLRDADTTARTGAATTLGIILSAERREREAAKALAKMTETMLLQSPALARAARANQPQAQPPLCSTSAAERARRALVRAVDRDADGGVRVMAMWALYISEPGPRYLDQIARSLADPFDDARLQASEMARRLGPHARPAAAAIIASLSDKHELVRSRACQTLEDIANVPEAVPALVRLLNDEPDPGVRCFAARALGACGPADERAMRALGKALADDQRDIRIIAAHLLARAGNAAAPARPDLERALSDPLPQVRENATRALQALDANK